MERQVYRFLSVAVAEIALCPCHCYEIVKVREISVIAAMQRPLQVQVLARPQTILVVGA
jgi:hypothetical protein